MASHAFGLHVKKQFLVQRSFLEETCFQWRKKDYFFLLLFRGTCLSDASLVSWCTGEKLATSERSTSLYLDSLTLQGLIYTYDISRCSGEFFSNFGTFLASAVSMSHLLHVLQWRHSCHEEPMQAVNFEYYKDISVNDTIKATRGVSTKCERTIHGKYGVTSNFVTHLKV